MVIKGLSRQGYRDLAYKIAKRHYESVLEVYRRTGTFYEYYAPEKIEPGFMARDHFVGWGGLAPIALLIEYLIGIEADYPEETIPWDIRQLEAHGIDRYPFGPEGSIELHCAQRSTPGERPRVTVHSNVPFTLILTYGEGKSETLHIQPD